MNHSPSRKEIQQLSELLSAELESACKLLALLEQEHQLLVKGEAEAIRSISEQKQAQIRQFNGQLLVRDRFLTVHQLPPGREGTDLFLQEIPQEESIRKCWSQIQKLAAELNDRNEVNGTIVALAQRHVRQALNLLTGRTDQSNTYSPAGQQSAQLPQSLAKV